MELMDTNLESIIDSNKMEDLNLKINISYKIISGLNYLHENNIYHSDLKPANILLSSDLEIVKLSDFGVSVISSQSKVTLSIKGGTFNFMAPEQILEYKINSRSDIYSFGIVLYNIFCKEMPWKNINMIDFISKLKNQETPDVEHLLIPLEMKEIMKDCLKYDPNDRPFSKELIERFLILKNK